MIDSSYHRSRFFSFARPEVGRVFQQTVRSTAAQNRGRITTGEPWSPKLSDDPRSLKGVFDEHGFQGGYAQRDVLSRLLKAGVEKAIYKNPSRNKAYGLRYEGKPNADWADDTQK